MLDKYGIISYPDSLNRGDEIQSIASKRLLPQVDYLVPRNDIHNFKSDNGEKVKLICNGWFSTSPEAWPPSKDLNPLFVSFHVTHDGDAIKKMISPKYKEYYQQFEPIGCRDVDTHNNFQALGVKSHFSGCITLTLDNPFEKRGEDILVVDPFYCFNYDQDYIKDCIDILVPTAYKSKVKFITHRIEKEDQAPVEEKFKIGEDLLAQFAKAKMVITSRIHCALPCLAMGTPVYFMDIGYNTPEQRNRFNGIIDLFNTIGDEYFPMPKNNKISYPLRKLKLYKLMKNRGDKIPIDWENPLPNKNLHLPIREKIKATVQDFIQVPV